MAFYKGREVQIVTDRPHKFTDRDQVLIQHSDDPSLGTEVVDRRQLVFSEEEIDAMLEQEKADMEARRESFQSDLKRREDEEKKSAEFQQEVAKAREDGKPANIYLKSATYNKGDQVVDEDGVLYRSRTNGNLGNAPGKDSDYWSVVLTDTSGTSALAAQRNVLQQSAPQAQVQNQPNQAVNTPATTTNTQRASTSNVGNRNAQAAQPVRNSETQRSQITPQRGR